MKRAILLMGLIAGMGAAIFAQNAALPRLAVVEFTTNVNTNKAKADVVTVRNVAESRMVETGKYRMMTRNEIDQLLANQRIQVSSISSADNIKKLQLQNISYIVTGSVDAMGDDYAVTVRVLDVSTGQYPHSANDFMGGDSRDLYNGINSLMTKFVAGMSSDASGAIVQGQARNAPSSTGISIEVSIKEGGILYLQNEEIAVLWDNDTYFIPVEKPGTYTVKMVFASGVEAIRSVTIASRGVTKVDFTYYVGVVGPAGGLIFYDKGSVSDGWRYLEAAPAETEFAAEFRGFSLKQLNIGGFTGWFLPSIDELDLMYKNLKEKGLGGFSDGYYWSSSQGIYSNHTYIKRFSDGAQISSYIDGNNTYAIRAIRQF